MPRPRRAWTDIVWSSDYPATVVSRATAAGDLVQLARGVYTPETRRPEAAVARNWQRILARELPGALIADASARWLAPRDGRLLVVHRRRKPLVLPGLRIEPRQGPGALPSDYRLGDEDVWVSSEARGLLDNLAEPSDRLLGSDDIERWIDQLASRREGAQLINRIRDEAREIAPAIRRRAAFERLEAIIRAVLSTGPATGLRTRELRARATGMPIDQARLPRIEAFASYLAQQAPNRLPDSPGLAVQRHLLPFYEAYFSNFIEGTEFTLDEAARIVFDDRAPQQRTQDAHDVISTYRLVTDQAWRARTPADADELVDLLIRRHEILMAARPDKGPGQFRQEDVHAGGTPFSPWETVEGTLRAGFEAGHRLVDPFSRALFLHFLVAEVHPFADGNGRSARLAMNAELSAASETRIVIPTGYRNDYLGGLAAGTNGHYQPMRDIMDFARRWTAQMDFSSRSVAEDLLARCNALVDPIVAIRDGIKLRLPTDLPQG